MSTDNVTAIKSEPERIAELKVAHGDVAVVRQDGSIFVFRAPSQPEIDRWHDGIRNDTGNAVAHRQMCVACCVEPGADAATALFKKKAMLATKLTDVLTDLAGADIAIEVSKS